MSDDPSTRPQRHLWPKLPRSNVPAAGMALAGGSLAWWITGQPGFGMAAAQLIFTVFTTPGRNQE